MSIAAFLGQSKGLGVGTRFAILFVAQGKLPLRTGIDPIAADPPRDLRPEHTGLRADVNRASAEIGHGDRASPRVARPMVRPERWLAL